MTIADAFARRAAEAPRTDRAVPLVRGQLFPIWLHPNERNDDRITIGVAFVDSAGTSHCKVAADFDFLQCLYGKQVDLDSFALMGDVLRADLQGTAWAAKRPPVSEAVSFGTPRFAAGFSIPEILERNFAIAVSVGNNDAASEANRPRMIIAKELTRQLAIQMTKRYGAKARQALSGEVVSLSNDFGRASTLHFDLRGARHSVGELVSAQGSAPTVKAHMQAAVNKALLFRLHAERNKVNRPIAMFVLEPSPYEIEMSKSRQQIIDTIGSSIDMAIGAGAVVHQATEVEVLAEQVGAWAGLKAAA